MVGAAGTFGAGIAALIAAPLYAGPGPEITFIIVAIVVLILSSLAMKLSGFKFSQPINEVLPHG